MKKENTKFYISTAIVYPNADVHVGFAWEVLGADMVARFKRMLGADVFFSTGTDEHSQNVQKAAERAGVAPRVYCDGMAEKIRAVMQTLDIAYDRFIRTSDADHELVAQKLIRRAFDAGDVYKKAYEGLYCESCETFYTEKEVATEAGAAPQCPTHKLALKVTKEENYFFKLSKYEAQIRELIQNNPAFLEPESRRNEVLAFLEQGLKDFSVSRTSFTWGVPLDFDPDHVVYVWYDALINYLSAVGYGSDEALFDRYWPCDVHVIGKDITRFHSIYWPAMLLSAGITLPKRVFAHGFMHLDGEKMSKTRGNIVRPEVVANDYGVSALRWYLLSANQFAQDSHYADKDLILKVNADLANNIGNCLSRTIAMAKKYFGGQVNGPAQWSAVRRDAVEGVDERFKAIFSDDPAAVLSKKIDDFDLQGYCELLVQFGVGLNKFIDETKPWSIAKQTDQQSQDILKSVLFSVLEGLRCLSIALWPVVPEASHGIASALGLPESAFFNQSTRAGVALRIPDIQNFKFSWQTQWNLQEVKPLFQRLEPIATN